MAEGDGNPYAPPDPERPPERPRQSIVLPGWLVLAFAIGGLLLPLAAVEDQPFGGREMKLNQIIWAAMYGVPAVAGAVVFGIANLRRGRDVGLSRAGLGIAVLTVIALPVALLLR